MTKIIKRLVAIVMAITLVVTGINFTPTQVSAATGDYVACVDGWTTTTSAWQCYTGTWSSATNPSTAQYKGGNELNNFELNVITNDPASGHADQLWAIQARSAYQTVEAGTEYTLKVAFNATGSEGKSITVNLEDDVDGSEKIKTETYGLKAGTNELTYTFVATTNSVRVALGLGLLDAGTSLDFTSFSLEKATVADDASTMLTMKLEAEAATIAGGAALMTSGNFSNGYGVGSIGSEGTTNGTATYSVYVAEPAAYNVVMFAASGSDRFFYITVNGTIYNYGDYRLNNGSWDTPTALSVTLNLAAGWNTIQFGGIGNETDGYEWAPNLDRIEITLNRADAIATVEAMIDKLPTGNITKNDEALVYGVKVAYDNLDLTGKNRVSNRATLENAVAALDATNKWTGIADATVEYYYRYTEPLNDGTLKIMDGTVEQADNIHLVFDEGVTSAVLKTADGAIAKDVDGNDVAPTVVGAGVSISKYHIVPNQTYTLEVTGANRSSILELKYEPAVDSNNIAVGKPVYTAGTYQANREPAKINDGSDFTRWASGNAGQDCWVYVDLGNLYEIEKVEVLFETAYAKDFEIQLSKDGNTWVTTRTVNNFLDGAQVGKGSFPYVSEGVCHGKARYVKLKVNAMGPIASLSIYEFKVFGTKVPGYISDVAVNKEVTANGEQRENPASDATDGKDTTKWVVDSTVANPEYIVNLGKTYELHSIDLKFGKNYTDAFTISTSKDGESWTELRNVAGWTEHGTVDSLADDDILGYSFHFDPVDAQYVKLNLNTNAGASIYEFEVWAKDNDKLDYWKNVASNAMGVYPVTKLQDTIYLNSINDTYPLGVIDSSLTTEDILISGDTYEVVYDPNDRDLYFYVNPRDININYDEQSVFWSNGNTGYMLWGAEHHDENIAKFVAKQQATAYYQLAENLDFGGNDYITTQIGCRIYNNSDLTDGIPNSGSSPVFTMYFNLKIYDAHNIYIDDNVAENGTLQVRDFSTAKKYIWEKSVDGVNWEPVAEKRYDITVITNNGATVNVANDFGGGYYYRVKEEGGVWSQPHHVKYYNNVQNGDFEYPAMFSYDEETNESMATRFPLNPVGDEQQFPNGFDGLFWKSTGPGWYNTHNNNKTTHDIEIVNGANLRTDWEANEQGQFSVSSLDMYADNSHGNQFAELNCEEQGALYQDILTTPGAECYWDLDHAARRVTNGATNSMLVVAMSTKDALNYTQDTEIQKIIDEATAQGVTSITDEYADGVEITLPDGSKATVWKVTSTTTAGQWKHNSGKYTVPISDENYLTRFFFVSIDGTDVGGGPDRTIGNLLDNITFEQRKAYKIEYYVNGELVETIPGVVDPYDRVYIPSTITNADLSQFTLRDSYVLKYRRDAEGNILYDDNGNPIQDEVDYFVDYSDRNFTVAYDHDTLRLYYESGIVTLLKRVDGMTSLPDGYQVTMTVRDPENPNADPILTHTFDKDDFSVIDEADGSTPDSFFATVAYNAADLGLDDGKAYIITEEGVDTMIDTSYYLSEIAVREQLHKVEMSEIKAGTTSCSEENVVYRSNAENTILFVNTYAPTHQVTLTKKVTGNMGEQEKDDKEFNFTVDIAKDSAAVDAVLYDIADGKTVTNSTTGKYEFTLKDSESISFLVYDGSTVTVTEGKEDWYSTTYTVDGVGTSVNNGVDVDATTDPVVTTEAIKADVDITCVNHSEDLGDVEVQGFQMNTNTSVGAPAEYTPSFRVVCRVSKNTIKRKKVLKAGVIFGTAEAVGTTEEDAISKLVINNNVTGEKSDNLANNGTAGANKPNGVDGAISDNIFYHEETPEGYYDKWTTKDDDEHPAKYWNYYALTFYGTSYMYGMITQDIVYRAYAIVEGTPDDYDYIDNGVYCKYEYGNDIYTINMFEIAQNLYENQKMSSLSQHNFLYNNILNVVTMDQNRLAIAQAMMVKLNITSYGHDYDLVNACYKNMYDYIHCVNNYKYSERGTDVPNMDFKFKNYNKDGATADEFYTELLNKLNTATNTEYDNLSEWIYEEVEKTPQKGAEDTNYSGFYRQASYDWNSGIVTEFEEDK